MIKAILPIFCLLILCQSMSYAQFEEARTSCAQTSTLGVACNFDPYTGNEPLQDEQLLCAQDYQKATLCFSLYKECFPSDDADRQAGTLPVVCWMCYIGLQSQSTIYQQYARCLQGKWEHHLVVITTVTLSLLITLVL